MESHIDDEMVYVRNAAQEHPLLRPTSPDPRITAPDFGRFRLSDAQKWLIHDGLKKTVRFVGRQTDAMIERGRKLVWRFEVSYDSNLELVKVEQTNPDGTREQTAPRDSGWPMRLSRTELGAFGRSKT